jgi:hypothetical protein
MEEIQAIFKIECDLTHLTKGINNDNKRTAND